MYMDRNLIFEYIPMTSGDHGAPPAIFWKAKKGSQLANYF